MKIRGTSTLQTDMLFLLIAVSYMLLASVSFDQKNEANIPVSASEQDERERVKILVTPAGTFEIREDNRRGGRVDIKTLARVHKGAGVEIHPSSDVLWRDIQVAYLFLVRSGVDVVIKPFSGGT